MDTVKIPFSDIVAIHHNDNNVIESVEISTTTVSSLCQEMMRRGNSATLRTIPLWKIKKWKVSYKLLGCKKMQNATINGLDQVDVVNIVKKHTRATGTVRQAGIIQKELPMPAANVMLICAHCNRPTRIGIKVLADATKARTCTRCQEVIE